MEMMTPVEQEPPKRGRNITVVVLVILLVLSGFMNIMFFVGLVAVSFAAAGASDGYTEVLIDGEEGAVDKILLLRVQGIIVRDGFSRRDANAVAYVRSRLKQARKEEKQFSGVLMVVNSPGGGVSESDVWKD